MPTTLRFDPIFEVYLTGNVDDIIVYDPDNTPNRVLPVGQQWRVEILWSLSGNYVTALGGEWHVLLSIEGMGPRLEDDICKGTKGYLDVEPGSNALVRRWKYTCNIPADKVTEEGVYKLATFIHYIDPLGNPLPMAGHAEEPLISFYNQ